MRVYLGIVLVLLVTLAVRVQGVTSESVWFDEAVTVVLMDEPSLWNFLDASRSVDKLKVPLYFVIEYAWWHSVSSSILGLRALSILIALISVVVLYFFTQRIAGLLPAIVAGLCFALSKPYIFYGQEIRMYGLMYLLALGSWWALYIATRGSRRGWYVNAALNLLLINTHLLGALSIASQFVFLFLENPRGWRRNAAWAVAHAVIALSVVPWVLRFASYEKAVAWIIQPPLWFLVETFVFVLPGTKFDCVDSVYGVGLATAIAFAVVTLPLAVLAARKLWSTIEERATAKLLVTWMFAPILGMFVASYVYTPCYVDRYALYAALPFFMLVGIGVGALRKHANVFAALLVAVLAGVNASTIERPMRPDMAHVGDLISFNAEEGDIIVTRGVGYAFSLAVYCPPAKANVGVPHEPMRQSVREVMQGARGWFVLDPQHDDYTQWRRSIDDAIEKGRVRLEMENTTDGKEPVEVLLLAPAQ